MPEQLHHRPQFLALIKAARKRAAPARPRPAGDLRPASAGPAGRPATLA
ncbi:hypothetical protein [Micromonospora sp. NPDC005413]